MKAVIIIASLGLTIIALIFIGGVAARILKAMYRKKP